MAEDKKSYVVYGFIPYEGESIVEHGDYETIKKFIKDPNRGYKLADLSIYIDEGPDVYEVFAEND